MLYNHLILCCCLLFLPSVFPSIRVFSYEPAFSHQVVKVLQRQPSINVTSVLLVTTPLLLLFIQMAFPLLLGLAPLLQALPICPQCLSDLRIPRQSWKVSRNLGPCFSTWVHVTIILGTFEQYQGLNPMPGDVDLIDLQPSWISRISKVLQVMLMLRTTRPVESLVNFDTEKTPRDMNGISYCFLIQHLQGEGEAGRVLCEILLDSLDYWYVNSSTTFFFFNFHFLVTPHDMLDLSSPTRD